MWQSFAAIGRGTSEIRLPKEKKHHGQNISPSRTAVPGGLKKKLLIVTDVNLFIRLQFRLQSINQNLFAAITTTYIYKTIIKSSGLPEKPNGSMNWLPNRT